MPRMKDPVELFVHSLGVVLTCYVVVYTIKGVRALWRAITSLSVERVARSAGRAAGRIERVASSAKRTAVEAFHDGRNT